MKQLSPAFPTLLMKILFPMVWISGFGWGTVRLWLGSGHGQDGPLPPDEMKWSFLLMWIIVTPALLWSCVGLKHVRRDATHLYISNFLKEIAVPLTQIVDVTENRMINFNPVTVHFRSPTEFGHKIKFMPNVGFLAGRPHPVMTELKRLASIEGQDTQLCAPADGSVSAGLRQPRR